MHSRTAAAFMQSRRAGLAAARALAGAKLAMFTRASKGKRSMRAPAAAGVEDPQIRQNLVEEARRW